MDERTDRLMNQIQAREMSSHPKSCSLAIILKVSLCYIFVSSFPFLSERKGSELVFHQMGY